MNNELFELYTLAELSYQKHFSNVNIDEKILYPEGWYDNKNYKEKIKIIYEAIKENKLIEHTNGYKNSLEGVVFVLKK